MRLSPETKSGITRICITGSILCIILSIFASGPAMEINLMACALPVPCLIIGNTKTKIASTVLIIVAGIAAYQDAKHARHIRKGLDTPQPPSHRSLALTRHLPTSP